MFMRLAKSFAIAAVAFGLSIPASAAVLFNFTFTAPWALSSQTASGSGQLYANDNGNGTFSVFDVVGTAKETATSASKALTDTALVAGFAQSTIFTNPGGGYSVNAIQLTGEDTYNFVNVLNATYTVTNGLRTSAGGTLNLSLAPAAAAVPEPASWLMMIVGFGLIGAVTRSQRRRRVLA